MDNVLAFADVLCLFVVGLCVSFCFVVFASVVVAVGVVVVVVFVAAVAF